MTEGRGYTGFCRPQLHVQGQQGLLHAPFHGHGTNVPPAPVQASGGLLDGVTLGLIGTGVRVMQQDITDVEHGLHPCAVLFDISLQILGHNRIRKAVRQRQWMEGWHQRFITHPSPSLGTQPGMHVGPTTQALYSPVPLYLTRSLRGGNRWDLRVELCEGWEWWGCLLHTDRWPC